MMGWNHKAECTTNDEASQNICKKCDVEVLCGQLAIMCGMCSIWFHEECSGLSKKQLNVIGGEIDASKWLCGWCLDNADDRLKCVSNNLEMKKNIEDIKRLVTSFNTNQPSYASKVSETPPTNVNETCTDKRKYPDEQTIYVSGTNDDDILSSSVLQRRKLYTHFPGIKQDFTFTNKLGKIVLLINNKTKTVALERKTRGVRIFSGQILDFFHRTKADHKGV